MERTIYKTSNPLAKPVKKVQADEKAEIVIRIPGRGETGMISVGTLIEPLKEIIQHPDRNRLLAEYFKDYKKDYR